MGKFAKNLNLGKRYLPPPHLVSTRHICISNFREIGQTVWMHEIISPLSSSIFRTDISALIFFPWVMREIWDFK